MSTSTKKSPSALGQLAHYLAPSKGKMILGTILGLLGTMTRLSAPLFIQQMSQALLDGIAKTPHAVDYTKIIMYGLIAIGAFLLGCCFDYINTALMVGVTAETSKRLRTEMFAKLHTMPLNYFDTREIGTVLSYFTNDVDILNQMLDLALSSFVSSFITVITVLGILFVFSWKMGLVALIAIPVALFFLGLIGKAGEKQFTARQNCLSSVSSLAEESYTAANIIKMFGASDRFIQSFDESNRKLDKSTRKANFFASLMNPVMTCIGNLMVAGICLVGAAIAADVIGSQGVLAKDPTAITASITLVVAAVNYGNQLVSPLSQLAQIFANLTQASAAASRIFAFLGEKDQEDETAKTGTIPAIEGNVSFSHVRFGYNKERVIIHDFSENAKHGQKVAIVGPTGAGKTTMVNLLMRFYDIDQGQIAIEGVDTRSLNRNYVRSLFGMVLQDTWLFEGTFMENLKFSRRDATDEEVYAACRATHCDEFIRAMPGGYNGMITEECGLSSGQKQLITIARAMVQNAPMLILDEATSSVDTRTELLIQDAMDQLMKGRTSFVIAHRLSTIKNSDLILVMKDGDVIESGNHDQLMAKNGFYADLYNAQFTGKGPQLA